MVVLIALVFLFVGCIERYAQGEMVRVVSTRVYYAYRCDAFSVFIGEYIVALTPNPMSFAPLLPCISVEDIVPVSEVIRHI
jgi:hypothetical protein